MRIFANSVQGNPQQLPRQSAYETVYQLPDTYQYADALQRNQGRDDIFVHESAARFHGLQHDAATLGNHGRNSARYAVAVLPQCKEPSSVRRRLFQSHFYDFCVSFPLKLCYATFSLSFFLRLATCLSLCMYHARPTSIAFLFSNR